MKNQTTFNPILTKMKRQMMILKKMTLSQDYLRSFLLSHFRNFLTWSRPKTKKRDREEVKEAQFQSAKKLKKTPITQDIDIMEMGVYYCSVGFVLRTAETQPESISDGIEMTSDLEAVKKRMEMQSQRLNILFVSN